jgi:hypothetical protein
MTDERPQRINIGFTGGQSVSARVKEAELTRLRQALAEPQWHDLKAEGGTITLDLTKVVFVQLADEEHRVGFGS